MRAPISALVVLLVSTVFGFATEEGEVLQMALPDGYEQGYSAGNETQRIVEFIPVGQSVENWQEMLSVQVFYGLTDVTAGGFANRILQGAAGACPGATGTVMRNEVERGYDIALFMTSCPDSATGETEEWTLFKAIQGADSLYLIHKAWAYQPDSDAVITWSRFMFGVGLCDSRKPDAPCQ
jgi:hypothetical protein